MWIRIIYSFTVYYFIINEKKCIKEISFCDNQKWKEMLDNYKSM